MKKFLVVDFEFTTYERPVGRPRGFFSEIIEIGAVKLDGEPLNRLRTHPELCQTAFLS